MEKNNDNRNESDDVDSLITGLASASLDDLEDLALTLLSNYFPREDWKKLENKFREGGDQLWNKLNPQKGKAVYQYREVVEFNNKYSQFAYIATSFLTRVTLYKTIFPNVQANVKQNWIPAEGEINVIILGCGPAPEIPGICAMVPAHRRKDLRFYCVDSADWVSVTQTKAEKLTQH